MDSVSGLSNKSVHWWRQWTVDDGTRKKPLFVYCLWRFSISLSAIRIVGDRLVSWSPQQRRKWNRFEAGRVDPPTAKERQTQLPLRGNRWISTLSKRRGGGPYSRGSLAENTRRSSGSDLRKWSRRTALEERLNLPQFLPSRDHKEVAVISFCWSPLRQWMDHKKQTLRVIRPEWASGIWC